jgi:hypothetical protein
MDVDHVRRPESAPWDDRPWTPGQCLVNSIFFAVAACGAVAGINFACLGKRHFLLPALFVGWALFLVEVRAVLFLVADG